MIAWKITYIDYNNNLCELIVNSSLDSIANYYLPNTNNVNETTIIKIEKIPLNM